MRTRAESTSIAVVGFDDIELAATPCYDLTTYSQPLDILK